MRALCGLRGVAKTLDHENKTSANPCGSFTRLEERLRQSHIVTPDGEILNGWDAAAYRCNRLSRNVLLTVRLFCLQEVVLPCTSGHFTGGMHDVCT